MAIGTPAYMSPEQAAGEREIDGRSDLYSLGIVGYQMLTGEPPFVASSTPAMLVKHISERPIPVEQRRPDVPPDLARAVMMLLEKEPANRFPSAAALVAALDARTRRRTRSSRDAQQSQRRAASRRLGGARRRSATPSGVSARRRAGCATTPATLPAPRIRSGRHGRRVRPARVTADEVRRWENPHVVAFRKKLAPYLFVNG